MVEVVNCVAKQIFVFPVVVHGLNFVFQLLDKLAHKLVIDKNIVRSRASLSEVEKA